MRMPQMRIASNQVTARTTLNHFASHARISVREQQANNNDTQFLVRGKRQSKKKNTQRVLDKEQRFSVPIGRGKVPGIPFG